MRHGETQINSGAWSAKPEETRLTELGKKQAEHGATQIMEQPDLFMCSPLIRAKETIQFLTDRWPNTPLSILPIQEFIYLSPSRLSGLTQVERKEAIREYWQRNDPNYCDGAGAESFANFLQRVLSFYQYITQQSGYIVAVGHGQFFKAFLLGLEHGFALSSTWMGLFREEETNNPIKNCGIIKLYFK